MMWYDWSSANWLWMSAMMLVFWSGLIVLAIWAIRSLSAPKPSGDAALDILRKRFAAGEISSAEFENSKKALRT